MAKYSRGAIFTPVDSIIIAVLSRITRLLASSVDNCPLQLRLSITFLLQVPVAMTTQVSLRSGGRCWKYAVQRYQKLCYNIWRYYTVCLPNTLFHTTECSRPCAYDCSVLVVSCNRANNLRRPERSKTYELLTCGHCPIETLSSFCQTSVMIIHLVFFCDYTQGLLFLIQGGCSFRPGSEKQGKRTDRIVHYTFITIFSHRFTFLLQI